MPLIALVTPKKVRRSVSLVSFLSLQEDEKLGESYHRSRSFTKYIDVLSEDAEDKENFYEPITDATIEIDEQIVDDITKSENQLTSDSLGLKRKRSYKDLKFVNTHSKQKTPESKTKELKDEKQTELPLRPNRRSFTKQISEYFEEKSEQNSRKLTRSTSLFNLRRANSEVNVPDELISVRDLNTRRDKNELNGSHFRLESYNQPTWRLWGEEKVEGAIYTVYLKKVRYNSPSRSLSVSEDDEDSISHLEWETVRIRFVKAGTMEKLVESLASDTGELESTYINVFLATYRTFASAKQVLNLLTERYDQLGGMGSQERVDQYRRTLRQALHVWLDQFPEDFKEPPNFPCLSHLESFCKKVMSGSELDSKVQRKGKLLRKEANMKDSPLIQQLLDSPNTPSSRYTNKSQSLPSYSSPPYTDILDIPTKHFAHQITAMDNELFKRVIPHQCLGSVWSRRDKSRDRDAATVVATIEQFNAVSYRVISTVLIDSDAKNSARGRVISAWVDIAQELRVLKNFSSLKAIVSGLQSNPVFRLKKAWHTVPRDKLEVFEELARIFSEDNNAVAQRELLVREGTARFADTAGENDHHLQKMLQKHQENSRAISYGTIPYLGTFLTDLTMIDTAIPDIVSEGLINFDKRRKEFEVLAQIKLLQGAANAYTIERDARFSKWFESVLIMDENEAHELSCQIELPHANTSSNNSKESRFRRRITPIINHRKNDSIASTVSGSSSSSTPMLCETDGSVREDDISTDMKMTTSLNDSVRSRVSSASSASIPSLDTSLASSSSPTKCDKSEKPGVTPQADPYRSPDFYIIRVSLEAATEATEGVIMYKSIMLSNREHTREVICSAMLKHGLEGSPDDFTLSQLLPDKELQIPPNANVYYAINTQHDLNFVLRPRVGKDLEKEAELFKNSTPGRKRDTSKARRKLLGLAL